MYPWSITGIGGSDHASREPRLIDVRLRAPSLFNNMAIENQFSCVGVDIVMRLSENRIAIPITVSTKNG